MDALAAGPRDFPDRAGVQPPGRRPARRLRSAAVLLLIVSAGACGRQEPEPPTEPVAQKPPEKEVPSEDFHKRFLERDYSGLKGFDADALIYGLRKYIESDGAIYPPEGRRNGSLHNYLYFAIPDPASLKPLLGARKEAKEIEDWVMRRDYVALAIVTSFYRRLARNRDDPYRAELWEALAYAGVHFSFDALYGESHTKTGAEIADLFVDPLLPAGKGSRDALTKHLDAMLDSWRSRVTEKASTTMMGIMIRHLGAAGLDRLFLEWKHMSASERYNLMAQSVGVEGPNAATRGMMVEALVAGSMELREAALWALEELEAPVQDLEIEAREEELQKALPALRRWAAKTDS